MHNPEVLFLDEPTTGLDPASRVEVWEVVQRLNRDLGATIFLTTQYREEADALADRLGIIDQGQIIAEGIPTERKRAIGADIVAVRVDDPVRAAEVIQPLPGIDGVEVCGDEVLAEKGVRVGSLTLREPTLDDVFLTLTGQHLEGVAA